MPSSTVILGAGISGLTAAYALSQRDPGEYAIYEQESAPGGLCRVFEKDGFSFDVVSHVLHFRSEGARQLVHEVLDGNLTRIERNAWIYYRGNYVPYPFQTHLGFLPMAEKLSCMLGYLRAWMTRQSNNSRPADNFANWIHQNFGKGISRHFMEPYNTAVWGVPPRELSVDWVRPFIPRTDLKQTMAGFFFKRTTDAGYNSSFYYPPQGGVQALVEGLARRLSTIHTHKTAVSIDLERRRVRFRDGEEVNYDHLISTIPLKTFVHMASGVPDKIRLAASKLRCTTLLNIVFGLRQRLPHDYHWVYFPQPEYPFFRLVFPSNICPSMAPNGFSIIAAEISNPDPSRRAELTEQTQSLLVDMDLIVDPSSIAFISGQYVNHAYPVHDLNREEHVRNILRFLNARNVHSIGRFGGWRYSSIDDAIAEALDVVQSLTRGSRIPIVGSGN